VVVELVSTLDAEAAGGSWQRQEQAAMLLTPGTILA
jgi:hypothetical protein